MFTARLCAPYIIRFIKLILRHHDTMDSGTTFSVVLAVQTSDQESALGIGNDHQIVPDDWPIEIMQLQQCHRCRSIFEYFVSTILVILHLE